MMFSVCYCMLLISWRHTLAECSTVLNIESTSVIARPVAYDLVMCRPKVHTAPAGTFSRLCLHALPSTSVLLGVSGRLQLGDHTAGWLPMTFHAHVPALHLHYRTPVITGCYHPVTC